MRLSRLELVNFRSFLGTHSHEFRDGATYILGRNETEGFSSNGAGKSALLNALVWALYGTLSTGAKKDALIHRAADEMRVAIRFDDGSVVQRYKRRGEPEVVEFFSEDVGGWVKGNGDDVQRRLVDWLGVSARLFFNSLWIDPSSKTVQFLFAAPSERLRIIQDLVDGDLFARLCARAKAQWKEAQEQRALLEAEARHAETRRKESRQREADARTRLEELEAERSEVHRERMREIGDALEAVRARRPALERDLAEARTDLADGSSRDASSLVQRIEAKTDEFRQRIDDLDRFLSVSRCPTCQQAMPASIRGDLRKKRGSLAQDVLRLERGREAKRRDLARYEALEQRIAEHGRALRDLGREEERLRGDLARERAAHERDVASAMAPLREILVREAVLQEEAGARLSALDEERAAVMETEALLRFWVDGFGGRGIQNLLLDDIRQLMRQFGRYYIGLLGRGTMQVEFPPDDRRFEVLLRLGDVEADISTFSRGEVWRANLAVLLSLHQTIRYLSGSRLEFLVLDDPAGDLDEAGVETLIETAEIIAKEVPHVLVTLPQEYPGIPPSRVLVVEKRDGASRIL